MKRLSFVAFLLLLSLCAGTHNTISVQEQLTVVSPKQRLIQRLKYGFDYHEVCPHWPGGTYTRDKKKCDQLVTTSLKLLLTDPLVQGADIDVLEGLYNEARGINSEWYAGNDKNILILIEDGACGHYRVAASDVYVIDKNTGQTRFTGQVAGNVDFAGVRSTQRGWEMVSDLCPGAPAYWDMWHIGFRAGQWGVDRFRPAEHYWETTSAQEHLVTIPEQTLAWTDQVGQVALTFWLYSRDTPCDKVANLDFYYQMHRKLQVIYQQKDENYIQISEKVLEEEIASSEAYNGPGFVKCIP